MKRGTPTHPKTERLMSDLGIGRAQAVGHLELLWHFTAQFTPRGDVGRWGNGEIEAACAWTGEPGKLVEGLVRGGWIDECHEKRLLVHDWAEHANRYVKKSLTDQGVDFHTLVKPATSSCQALLPSLPKPSQASPGHTTDTRPAEPGSDVQLESEAHEPAGNPAATDPAKRPRAPRAPRAPGSLEADGAMDALIAVIDEVVPGSSIPDPGTAGHRAWTLELDRLHTLGEPGSKGPGWDWSTIHRVIAWLPRSERGGDFSWARVVRSGSKLRKHFARILADLEAESRPAPQRMSEMDRNLAEINEKYRRSLDADDSGQRDEAGESVPGAGEVGEDRCDGAGTDPVE